MSEVREVRGPLLPWPAEALADLLDVPLPDLAGGDGLPLGWHWLHLLDHPRQADLGPDGHPVRGVFPSPPAPGLRRMWAGGALTGLGPLRTGEETVRRSQVLESSTKTGRSGTLQFVTVQHELLQRGEVVVRERQDIVYREPVAAAAPAPPAEAPAVPLAPGDREVPVSPTLLFRYSALTYNAHRIHYDRDYARDVEGYPGLVTHGPLQALAMAESLRAHGAPGRGTFDYRLVAPLFDFQGLVVRTDADPASGALRTTARDRSGRVTAQGTYTPL